MEIPESIRGKLRQCARAVTFHTGVAEAPIGILGTSFLVGFRQKGVFLLTARHVAPNDESVRRLMIFPRDQPIESMRIKKWWFVQTTEVESEDVDHEASDLLIMHIDHERLPEDDRKGSIVMIIDSPQSWFEERHTLQFFLCGYPSIENSVNYENLSLQTSQIILSGRYQRRDLYSNVSHELIIVNSDSLSDFNGLSGSPVFCTSSVSARGRHPRFCGIALRGDANFKSVHFLAAEAIFLPLQKIDLSTGK